VVLHRQQAVERSKNEATPFAPFALPVDVNFATNGGIRAKADGLA